MARYLSGQWNAICDICGFKFKSSELKENWKGLRVCSHDYESRHPQELLRIRTDEVTVPWVRPVVDIFRRWTTFKDTVVLLPATQTQDYVDQTYFLETYTQARLALTVSFVRDFVDVVSVTDTNPSLELTKPFTDTVVVSDIVSTLLLTNKDILDSVIITDSGLILHDNYIDPSYFEADYVADHIYF